MGAYRAKSFGIVRRALRPKGNIAVGVSARQGEVHETLGGLGRLRFNLGRSLAESSQEIVAVCLYYIRPATVVVCPNERHQERAGKEQMYRRHPFAIQCHGFPHDEDS